MAIPSGNEIVRPFLPAKDFDRSKAFYEALGFEKLLDSDVAIFASGGSGFILQRYYQKEWAENSMMQLMVDDLDAWWAHIEALDLAGVFGVTAPRPPAMQPWGLRVAYVFDPCGVSPKHSGSRSKTSSDSSVTSTVARHSATSCARPRAIGSKQSPIDRNQVEDLIVETNRAISVARERGIGIVAIGNEFAPNDRLMNILRRHAAIAGSTGAAWDDRIVVVDAPYFTKQRGDAFSNEGLRQHLAALEIEEVALAGLMAKACITALHGAR